MNRKPLVLAGSLLLALAACGSSAADRGTAGTAVVPPASASPSLPATGTPPVAASPEIRIWGGFAVSIPYGSFAEWAREAARGKGTGIALVRVTDVSGVRWSTASGEGPGPADIARASRGEAGFAIGRLVTVELVRMLRGTWPASGATALYWLPGGQIGNDQTPSFSGDLGLIEPRAGLLAVASTWPGIDFDPTDGVLWANVAELFPSDASGRLWTYNRDETIRVDDLERYLPAP